MGNATAESRFRWVPDEKVRANAQLTRFMKALGVPDYEELLRRSNADPAWFWESVLKHIDFRFTKPYDKILDTSKGIERARWCVGAETNFVLNCIDRHRGTPTWQKTYLVWEGEDGRVSEHTYAQFDAEVCRFANGLKAMGIGKGDVVGLYMPQVPETFISYFAIMKIGAICMPLFSGFGEAPIATRLNDGGAKAVVTVDGTWRRGKPGAMKGVLDLALAHAPSVQKVIVVKHLADKMPVTMAAGRDVWWSDFVAGQAAECATVSMPAETPAALLFTSGTTGKPKGALYTHMNFIVKSVMDYGICTDFGPDDRWFFLSDMGWMVGSMCAVVPTYQGGSLFIAEGAPDFPTTDRYWRMIDQHKVTYLGLAPTVVRTLMRYDVNEVRRYKFDALRIIFSGGEPWTDTPWNWLFDNVCHGRVPILNGTGGTEVGGCIAVGNLLYPLKPGSICRGAPGMGADVVDDNGSSVGPNQVGELVLRVPSIGLTPGLWKDPGDERFLDSYWRTIPGMWRQGDWAVRDDDGLWFILGRSDDTIKISGKRTGPAEIEGLLLETGKVSEAAAIAVPDTVKGSALILVCVAMPGVKPDDAVRQELHDAVTRGMGRSYQPKAVVFVSDLPRTRNMKIMRRVVRAAFTGENPGDVSALVNPEVVEELKKLATA